MPRHFNTHIEGLDLQFWHDLIESRGELVSLKKGEYLCSKGEPTNVCGYVKSGYFIYKVDGLNKIGGFAFPEALIGDYPSCMNNAPAMFDIIAGRKSEVWVMDATILPKLFEEDIETGRQGRLFMEAAYVSLAKRYYALYAKTPTERYLDLVHEHPASVALDTEYRPDIPVIVGRVKDEKIPEWSAATENRIGKRIGFVYKDSVIMAPTVNCRLESGTFTIECQDSVLIRKIYNSLSDVSKVCVDSMNEEGTEHMSYGSMLRKRETKVVKICISR